MPIDTAFVTRLKTALDGADGVPDREHGRKAWLEREIGRHIEGKAPGFESVNRWFHGRSKPRNSNVEALCKVLNVDPAWLMFGTTPPGTRKDRVLATSRADGAVHFVIGAMLLEGMAAGLPQQNDAFAASANIDIEAIINRQIRRFTVSSAEKNEQGYVARPRIPSANNDHLIVIPGAAGHHAILHIQAIRASDVMIGHNDHAEITFRVHDKRKVTVQGPDSILETSILETFLTIG
jgi:transcriptional regulator with XRE-family HTH domain